MKKIHLSISYPKLDPTMITSQIASQIKHLKSVGYTFKGPTTCSNNYPSFIAHVSNQGCSLSGTKEECSNFIMQLFQLTDTLSIYIDEGPDNDNDPCGFEISKNIGSIELANTLEQSYNKVHGDN